MSELYSGATYIPEVNGTGSDAYKEEWAGKAVNTVFGETVQDGWELVRTDFNKTCIDTLPTIIKEHCDNPHLASALETIPDHSRRTLLHYILNNPTENPSDMVDALGGVKPTDFVPVFQSAHQKMFPRNSSHCDTNSVAPDQALDIASYQRDPLPGYEELLMQFESTGYLVSVPEHLQDLAKLMLYNALRTQTEPTNDVVRTILTRLERLEESEAAHRRSHMPTQGIEVESDHWHHNTLEAISRLGIPFYKEVRGGPKLWEVPIEYSHSHDSQAAKLVELTRLGFHPVPENDVRVNNLHPKYPISTHLNHGTDGTIPVEQLYAHQDGFYLLSDSLAIAYTTPQRVEKRKTSLSLAIDTGTPARNNGHTNHGIHRVEYRVNNYSGDEGLLRDAQLATGAKFADIKIASGIPTTTTERYLGELWGTMEQDLIDLLGPFGAGTNMFDVDKQRAHAVVSDPHAVELARNILEYYSNRVNQLIVSP